MVMTESTLDGESRLSGSIDMSAAIPFYRRGFIIVLAFQLAGLGGQVYGGQPLPAPVPSRQVATPVDSGIVENAGPAPAIVFETTIEVPDAVWLRLAFAEVVLAGSEADGTASYLLLTSLTDGGHQVLYAGNLDEWGNTSAYFNGEAVQIDLVASPGTGPNRLVINETTAGIRPIEPRSICGPTDDRILSYDVRAGRVMPIGCTGWMIGDANHCLLTAGHCISNGSSGVVMEFNVPLSNPSGSVNHPPPEDQYPVDPVSIQSNGGGGVGNDWAYFGCFPNSTTGLTPFQGQGGSYILSPPPAVSGQTIRITGYGTTDPPVSPTWNQVQKTHTGPYYSFGGTTVRYVVDTTGGNSGSPIINEDTGFAIGIHTHGGCSSGANSGTGSNRSALQNALANPLGVCALVPPAIISETPARGSRIGELPSVSVTFSEPVTGVVAGDLTVNGSAATSVAGTGAGPYEFSGYAVQPDGTANVVVGFGLIEDLQGNPFGGDSWTYTLDSSDWHPPQPSPMTYELPPAPLSTTELTMTATQAIDDTLPVEYYFFWWGDGIGGDSSGWQLARPYNDTGLTANTVYTYVVRARDNADPRNYTIYSAPASGATHMESPTGVSFGAVTDTSIEVTATGAFTNLTLDQSAIFFEMTPAEGSGANVWLQTTTTNVTGLTPGTTYTFRVKSKNAYGVEPPLPWVGPFIQSTSGGVPCVLAGDLNGDGVVSGADIPGYVRAKLGQPAEPGENPACAEFGTGTLAGDNTAFVAALLGT